MSDIFDAGGTPLDPGIALIEASAGTGKTFAIAGMVVRLIAEHGFGLNEILVVTFTEAATRELRDRVRRRIREAAVLLEEGRPGEDPALANLAGAGTERMQLAARALKNALLCFDEAAIFTIHGFCQRMLRENAFETGALFDVELLADAEPVWRETAEDFWRRQFYEMDPDLGSLVVALGGEISIDRFVEVLRRISRHPELKILAGEDSIDLEECQSRLRQVIAELRQEWRTAAKVVSDLLRGTHALSTNKRDGYPPAVIESILGELARLEEERPLPPGAFSALRKISARRLESKTVRKRSPPSHPFFERCAELEQLSGIFVRLVRRKFLEEAAAALAEAKKRRSIVTYDDLLTRLFETLRGPGGPALASAIGGRFRAALIDEFQDTDPIQWEIFHRIFGGGHHLLVLIGDPKQAIYGFRGADIFTYMEARSKARVRFTLGTNWRSDPALVEGANRLFSRHQDVFVFPEITFSPVRAAPRPEGPELDPGESGLSPQPLQMVCVDSEDGEPLKAEPAREKILGMMLGEINRLLTAGVARNGERLAPGDIAILVRSNREAEKVREQLVQAGIPAVVRTDRSVFQTEEAEHLLRLLAAILEPHKSGVVKAALASPLFEFDAARIHVIERDETAWQELTARFYEWQELWSRHGFMRMFRAIASAERINERLLGLADGERIVTNCQHLAECLHSAEYERILTPSTLLRWLREQRERPEGDSDSYVLRLEKDENAVQIVTIHRSKGLEYPVVFCPYNWTALIGPHRAGEILFHDEADGKRLTWDLREEPDPANVEAFRREQLAEAIRLLYVAVTRARNRCYLFWAITKDSDRADNCALAHLFGCGSAGGPETPFVAFEALADGVHLGLHRETEPASNERYRIARGDVGAVAARRFKRRIPQAPLVTSFSGLVARAHEEGPDRDAPPEGTPPVRSRLDGGMEGKPSIFGFPRGSKAGNFFHKILETLDFTCPASLPALVGEELAAFRFDASFAPVVTAKLEELLSLPLADGLVLGELNPRDRLVEAPFYFPIRPVTPSALAGLFEGGNLADFSRGLGRLRFYPVHGYMTGFIDLVARRGERYYIIDWKSNWLGSSAEDYGGAALRQAMSDSYYYLQYHLYTLALHRHLSRVLPGYDYHRHFGGVLYVFLRGINAGVPSSGIFHDCPPLRLVEEMQALLMPEAGVEVEEV